MANTGFDRTKLFAVNIIRIDAVAKIPDKAVEVRCRINGIPTAEIVCELGKRLYHGIDMPVIVKLLKAFAASHFKILVKCIFCRYYRFRFFYFCAVFFPGTIPIA